MLYGLQRLYREDIYEAPFISGYWIKTVPILLEIGMVTKINVSWTGICPIGARLFAELSGDNQLTWQKIKSGEDCYIFFNTKDAGYKNLYLKMGFETNSKDITPYYTNININIYQMYTAYRLYYDILTSANLTPAKFWIDPELFQFLIPYSWVKRSSHYDALNQVTKFCLAQVYVDRNDVIRIEGPNFSPDLTPKQTITASIYYKKTPIVRSNIPPNQVLLFATPFSLAATTEEIYRSGIPEIISSGETKTITAIYSVAQTPVINCIASIDGTPSDISIIGEEYFTWGAKIKVFSTVNSSFTLIIDGHALRIKGRIPITKTVFDALIPTAKGNLYKETVTGETLYYVHNNREENSIRAITYTMNHLLQTYEMADKIAGIIVTKFANPRKSYIVDYPGNPALTLDDIVSIGKLRYSGTDDYRILSHELILNNNALQGKCLVRSL